MDKWEYKVMPFEDGTDVEALDEAGADGWEAYAVVQTTLIKHIGDIGYPFTAIVHYFKRRIRDDKPVVD